MITREETKEHLQPFFHRLVDLIFDQQDQLQQHIKSLEARLGNTEQLTCDGCIYSICDATAYAECASACYKCVRQPYKKDMYNFTPKGTK